MARVEYLKMKTDRVNEELLESDLNDLATAARKLAKHAISLGGVGIGTSILKWLATIAAIYLLILDQTNRRADMLTSLLVPYIFFHFRQGQVGRWIAFIAVILRLFFPRHFPDWLEMLILILVVAPSFFASTLRDGIVGVIICLIA